MAENSGTSAASGDSYFEQLKRKMLEKNDEKPKENEPKENQYFSEEQRIYKNLLSEKELAAAKEKLEIEAGEIEKELPAPKEESPSQQSSPEKSGAFDLLKNLTKKNDPQNEDEDLQDKKITKEEEERINNLYWMKREIIEAPSEKDFEGNNITQEKPPEVRESKVGGKIYFDDSGFEIKRNEPISKPIETKKENEKTFDWAKSTAKSEPLAQATPETKKETPKAEDTFKKSDVSFAKPQETKDILDSTQFKTPIDEAFEVIEKYNKADLGDIAQLMKADYFEVEKIMKTFEDEGVVEIDYPTSLNKKPTVVLKNPIKSKMREKPKGKLIDTYNLIVDKVPAKISVILSDEENRPVYCIEMPTVGKYTKKFIDFIKGEIAENMPIELDEILDPKKAQKLKERFFEESKKRLVDYFPNTKSETMEMLSGVILHEMYGLGDIELLMGDDMLEEVGINSAKTPITVYHRIYGWLKTNMYPGSEEEIMNFSSQIGRKVGREITTLNPILDAHLLSGDRVNATLFPISSEGNTLTIRRFARRPWTLVDFIGKAHTMNSEMAALIWLAMQYEMNIVIAGGTASGKTSALNTMLSLVPSYHRIISIEDVREIVLPKFLEWNWIPMVTRSPNPEGLGEVTMLDCMVSSLRMRPDRIIVGEIRRKKEAEVLMEAIETGHSIYSTIHANSAYQVLRRLAEPPMSIPLMQIELIDLIVIQFRDRKTNKRRTFEIAEIEQTSTGKGLQVNTVYKWVPRTDTWEKLNKPNKILTMLNLHTGLTEDEVVKELKEREFILDWMKNNNMSELDMIGYVVKMFYADPARVKKMAKDNVSFNEVQKMMDEKVTQ